MPNNSLTPFGWMTLRRVAGLLGQHTRRNKPFTQPYMDSEFLAELERLAAPSHTGPATQSAPDRSAQAGYSLKNIKKRYSDNYFPFEQEFWLAEKKT